jgi:hypothetical protein
MNYYWYDDNGKIVQGIWNYNIDNITESALSKRYHGVQSRMQIQNIHDFYVVKGELKRMPEKENPYQIWDWSTHRWITTEQLSKAKEDKITEFKQQRDKELLEGVYYAGNTFDSDENSKNRLMGLMFSSAYSNSWITKDNRSVYLSKDDIEPLLKLMVEHYSGIYNHYQYKREEVLKANTMEAVLKVTWS